MKNKILLLLIVFNVLFAAALKAQQKPLDFSIKVYGGYGLFAPGGDLFPFFVDGTKDGMGNKAHFGTGLSLKLSDLVSIGVDADYLTGKKQESYNVHPGTTDSFSNIGYQESKYSVLSLVPNISFKLWSNPKFRIYNTLGIIATLKTNVELINSYTSHQPASTGFPLTIIVQDDTYKYGFNAGIRDAFGLQFNLAKNIRGFAEIFGYFLSVSPNTDTYIITDNIPGQSTTVTTSITHYSRSGSINFQYSTSTTGGVRQDSGSQNTFTPSSQHINAIGLNAGIIIDLKK